MAWPIHYAADTQVEVNYEGMPKSMLSVDH